MKTYVLGIALAACGWPAVPFMNAGGRAAGPDSWLTDYDSAKSLARRTGKPMMIVFRCEP